MNFARQAADDSTDSDLLSDVGNEIKVTLDRWSVGQLGVTDLLIAAGILAVGALAAWIASRVAKRLARRTDGAAQAAIATTGLLLGSSLMLLAMVLALEVLGFSIGPVLVLILIVVVMLLLLRPMITNLSSGLLLQVRGAIEAGDLVKTNGVLGTVHEINARSVVLDTGDGRRIHVPNTAVLADEIENYTSLGRRRSWFELMIPAQSDPAVVTATILESLGETSAILHDPSPEVRVIGLVGQTARLRVHVWHEPSTRAQRVAVDEGARAVLAAFRAGDIALDGPQWMVMDPTAHSQDRSGAGDQ